MLNLINEVSDSGERRFGPGYFDLVIVDEAHRSIFNKYKAIFDYFDALLVGLTATPKNEIDRNTYRVFNLEEGNPTDAYDLEQAKADGYLVGPFTINVPLKFPQRGIRYDDLPDEEKAQWDDLEWDEEDGAPDEVGADEVNRFLFNDDTIDKMLQTVMTYGYRVQGGDRLGKTIVFARNQRARRVHRRAVRQALPRARRRVRPGHQLQDPRRGSAHRPVPAQGLRRCDMAVSVDMLDTGIDMPGGRQPGLRQAGPLQDQVLADDRPRHPPVQGPVRPRPGQAAVPGLRPGPQRRVLQRRHPARPRDARSSR